MNRNLPLPTDYKAQRTGKAVLAIYARQECTIRHLWISRHCYATYKIKKQGEKTAWYMLPCWKRDRLFHPLLLSSSVLLVIESSAGFCERYLRASDDRHVPPGLKECKCSCKSKIQKKVNVDLGEALLLILYSFSVQFSFFL